MCTSCTKKYGQQPFSSKLKTTSFNQDDCQYTYEQIENKYNELLTSIENSVNKELNIAILKSALNAYYTNCNKYNSRLNSIL